MNGNFANQLKKLQVDKVDLLLIHWPFLSGKNGYPTLAESWLGLEALKKRGLAKSIGVSNYRIKDLELTLSVAAPNSIAVNQIELHPYIYERSKPLLAFCKAQNITIEAYAPTAPLNKFPGGPLDPVLDRIAAAVSARSGKTVVPSQILLKWISQLGHVVVTTSGKDWRMKEQLESYAIGELLQSEMEEIEIVGATVVGNKRVYMPHMDDDNFGSK